MIDRSIQENRVLWSGLICVACTAAIFFGGGPYYLFRSYVDRILHPDYRLFVEVDCDKPYRLSFSAFLDSENMLRAYPKLLDESGKYVVPAGHCDKIKIEYDGNIKLIRTFSKSGNDRKFTNQLFHSVDGYVKYDEASFTPNNGMDSAFLLELEPHISAKTFSRRQFQLSLIFKQRFTHANPQAEFLLHMNNQAKVNLQSRQDDPFYEIARASEDHGTWPGGYKFVPNHEIYERPEAGDYIRVDFEYASEFWKSIEEYGLSALSALLSIGLSIVIDSYIALWTFGGYRLRR